VRLAARQEHSAPIITALKPWFEKQLSMISSGSRLAEDIRYGLAHWVGLTRFLDDGRLELDTNPVENAIRPICLTTSFFRIDKALSSLPFVASAGRFTGYDPG
jgi:hypothetical protein